MLAMKKLKAIFKGDAVRCEKCGVEIWEGVDCDCGVDGADHEGVTEAYEQKKEAECKAWTYEKEDLLKQLRREKAKVIRDQKRVRKYSPRKKDSSVYQSTNEEKQK